MPEAAVAALVLLAAVTAARVLTARAALLAPARSAPVDDVTVLVAVRSGDPLLTDRLTLSVSTLAPARVLLLVDDDDPDGETAARTAAAGRGHAEVVVFGPPPPGTNPKVHKLVGAQRLCGPLVGLLDDDTVLPPGGLATLAGALDAAELVTGVPVYLEQGSLWSRLVAAFVNGSALVTYLPMARLGPPVSVNGMVVLTRRSDLESAGGFAAIATATCDDYALALAYRRHGMRIGQVAQPAYLTTTVDSPVAYLRLMRRWMLFAEQVVRRDLSARLVLCVVLPSVLPAVTLGLSLAAGPVHVAATFAVLVLGALGTRDLRRLAGGRPAAGTASASAAPARPPAARGTGHGATGLVGVLLEPVAALLAPVHLLTAVLGSPDVVWRGRRVRVGTGAATS